MTTEEQKKIFTLASYQERLDKVCDEHDSKMSHWDEKAKLKTESEKRMWEEGKIMIREHRKEAQRAIHHMMSISPEDWDARHDDFESKFADVVSAYHQATSKIR